MAWRRRRRPEANCGARGCSSSRIETYSCPSQRRSHGAPPPAWRPTWNPSRGFKPAPRRGASLPLELRRSGRRVFRVLRLVIRRRWGPSAAHPRRALGGGGAAASASHHRGGGHSRRRGQRQSSRHRAGGALRRRRLHRAHHGQQDGLAQASQMLQLFGGVVGHPKVGGQRRALRRRLVDGGPVVGQRRILLVVEKPLAAAGRSGRRACSCAPARAWAGVAPQPGAGRAGFARGGAASPQG